MIASRPHLLPRLSSLLAAVAALLLLPFVGLSPASAHTALVSSDPADGAQLKQAPTSIALTFTETMSTDLSAVTLRVAKSPAIKLPLSSGATPEVLLAEVPAELPAGEKWTVAYRVVSRDGHPVTGELNFTVAAAAVSPTPAPTTPPAEPTDTATPDAAQEPEREADTDTDTDDSSAAWWWTVGGIAVVVIAGFGVVAARANRRRG